MIKVSHESPLVLLEESRYYNDYDYALVHLFEEIEEYFNFFKKSLEMGREVILDNSIFELGEAFDSDKFAEWVKKLKPTVYIIPDFLEDSQKTISKLRSWMDKHSDVPGIKMGVIQGKTYEELVECYKEVDKYCDRIAISFDYSHYNTLIYSPDKLVNWMKGRQTLIDKLIEDGVINKNKHHHLLGCSIPQEFSYYKGERYDFVKSLDTSNPIVHGIRNITYKDFGLDRKESVKLVELINCKLDESQLDNIYFNIRKFKQIVNGK